MTDAHDTPDPGAWPDAPSLPARKAPPAEWARFYRDQCGWIVLPTPGPADIDGVATKTYNDAVLDYRSDYGGDPDEETRVAFWAMCRNAPDLRRLEKAVWWQVKAKDFSRPEAVTDALIKQWWGTPRGKQRGIAVVPGVGRWPVVFVDVDQHGDDPEKWGDLDGPWGRGVDPATGMRLRGPRSITPGGGLHTLVAYTGAEVSSAGRTALAAGVEVKAKGSSPVKVPAGSATPGRWWEQWEQPQPGPDALRAARRPAPRPDDDEREPGDDDEPVGSGLVARTILADAGDGERNAGAAAIVGILARPCACPGDVVQAALTLLAENYAGPREHLAGSTQGAEQAVRWRHALTRGPRDAEFAAEVVATWIRVHDTGRPPWTESKAERVARSMWRSAARRLSSQGQEAGAEDLGAGPMLAAAPVGWLSAPLPPPATCKEPLQVAEPVEPSPSPSPPSPPATVPPIIEPPPPAAALSPAQQAAEVARSAARWRGGIDPRMYVNTLAEAYTDDDLQADLAREPIQIGEVMPAVDFLSGRYLEASADTITAPLSHGWGEGLNQAMGGLRAGDFVVVGASGAGAGKTWFACWLANGLAMQTATRLLGWQGQADAPLVLPIWVTEMMSKSDLYLRLAGAHLGFDVAAITRGRQAHEAPGILAMAQRLGMTPVEVVTRARMLERAHGTSELSPMGLARHRLIKHVRLSRLPRRSRQAGIVVDHRSGPVLVDHLADAVDCYREEFAALAGVTPDKVFPLAVIDPTQRFTAGEHEKRAIDEFVGAAAQVLCSELDAAVIATCDTTKAAATDIRVTDFLGMEAKALEARVLAGSYGIVHNATHCVLLQAEHPLDGGLRSRQWARLTKNRSGGPAASGFPFGWERHLGRYIPETPEALSKFAEAAAAQGQPKRPGGGQTVYTGPRYGVASPAMLRRDHERD